MNQNRLKSPVVWTAICAQVLSILVLMGVILPEASDTINGVIASVIQLLVLFGVLNNPTDSTSF